MVEINHLLIYFLVGRGAERQDIFAYSIIKLLRHNGGKR